MCKRYSQFQKIIAILLFTTTDCGYNHPCFSQNG